MKGLYSDQENWATINLIDVTYTNLGGWIIQGVDVMWKHRGTGAASRLMAQVLEDADREDVPLYLAICPDPPSDRFKPLSYEQLESWYRRCGFVPYEDHDNAFWRPRASEQQDPTAVASPGRPRATA